MQVNQPIQVVLWNGEQRCRIGLHCSRVIVEDCLEQTIKIGRYQLRLAGPIATKGSQRLVSGISVARQRVAGHLRHQRIKNPLRPIR